MKTPFLFVLVVDFCFVLFVFFSYSRVCFGDGKKKKNKSPRVSFFPLLDSVILFFQNAPLGGCFFIIFVLSTPSDTTPFSFLPLFFCFLNFSLRTAWLVFKKNGVHVLQITSTKGMMMYGFFFL
jgi:hypothetical protein